MRQTIRRLLFGALLVCAAAWTLALDVPKLQSRVTDLAGVLTPEQATGLETKLKELETTDSTQIAVLVIPGLQGESLEDYSVRVASAWRLGEKGRDNGALLLVAMKERKLRIEAGYGLEPTLTDARSRRIIQDEILPRFRQGDFYGGIDAGVTAMMQVVRGTYQPLSRPPGTTTGRGSTGRRSYDWVIILLFPALWVLGSTGAWGGGLLGAGAAAFLIYSTVATFFGIPLLIAGLIGGALGAFLGALVRAGTRSPSGRRWGGYGGPFFTGGGFGGGFSGGGGSFGGGGSSGSW